MVECDCCVPRLETKRLILDAHRSDDLEPLAAMWSDPTVVAAIGGIPFTRQESWFRLLRYRGLWSVLGFGYWAIRDRASGAYVGDVGFADFHRESARFIKGRPEAGWALIKSAHGRGYGTEAVAAALSWLDGKRGFGQAVCLIGRTNLVSMRLAERQGFSDPTALPGDNDTLLLTRSVSIQQVSTAP